MGSNSLSGFMPLLGNLGIAGLGLWLFIKGVIVTGTERDYWRKAAEDANAARLDLEKALAVERERANVAITNAAANRSMLEEMKSVGEGRAQ